MTLKISKYRLAVGFIILIGPILDLLTGYLRLVRGYTSELTPGVLYRGLVLTPVFFLLIHRLKSNYFRLVVYYFLLVLIVGIGVHFRSGCEIDLVGHVQRFLKILFPILGFGALVYLGNRFPRSRDERFLWKVMGLYGIVTAGSILLFFAMGKGVTTYRYGFSFKGFYGSQNSMGFIFVASLAGSLYYIYAYKRNSLILILAVEILFLLAAFLVGTRAAIVGVPTTVALFHGFTFFKKGRGQKLPPAVYNPFLLVMVLLVGFWVYRYWASHYDISFIQRKFELLLNEGGTAYGTEHFRAKVPLGIKQISGFSFGEHLFGVGDAEFDLTENDLVDIYGKFGLLVLIPLLFFLGYYYVGALLVFARQRSVSAFALLLSLSFYIVHAALAGHALSIAQSNNLSMLVYYLIYCEMHPSRCGVWTG